MGELWKCGGGWRDVYVVSFTFRCEDQENKTLKLEWKEEISVEVAVAEDEFKNVVQGRGGRRG